MRKACAWSAALLVAGVVLLAAPAVPQEAGGTAARDSSVIAGPIPEKITARSVVVWWQTTAPEESILVYGTAPDELSYRVQRPWSTTTHEISLKKLQPATTYYLAILQPDGAKNASSQFTTQPLGYAGQSDVRITNGPHFEQITPESATITWSANRPSFFLVHYGTDPQTLHEMAKAPWTPTTHRVLLNNLQPDTRYYFNIEAKQQLPEANQAPRAGEQTSAANSSLPAQGEEGVPQSVPPAPIYAFRTLARGQQALEIGPQH